MIPAQITDDCQVKRRRGGGLYRIKYLRPLIGEGVQVDNGGLRRSTWKNGYVFFLYCKCVHDERLRYIFLVLYRPTQLFG